MVSRNRTGIDRTEQTINVIIIFIIFFKILTESEQMRKEADDVGPKAELDHWKKRLARYDSLTTCIKSHQCKIVVSILIVAKSKVLKVINST